MLLGNIEFEGFVLNASGARGFFGETYPLPHPGFLADWKGSIFVTKTVTWSPRLGNMPLREDGVTPEERFPRSIIVKPWGGHVLNCVNLSNAGAEALYAMGHWHKLDQLVLSFMAVGERKQQRIGEWIQFLRFISTVRSTLPAKFAIEINIACPNTGHNMADLLAEVKTMLKIGCAQLAVPFIVCINLLVEPETAFEISQLPGCAAVSQSNSIPWGEYPDDIPWKKIFGTDESPLVARGFKAGGYSGPYALPILLRWLGKLRYVRGACATRWLIAGGGIQSVDDALTVCRVADPMLRAIKLGVVGLLRPGRVQPIIREVNRYMGYADKTKIRKEKP